MRTVKVLLLAALIAATVSAANHEKKKDAHLDFQERVHDMSLTSRHKRLVGHLDELRDRLTLHGGAMTHASKGIAQAMKLADLKRQFAAQQGSTELYTRCLSDTNFLQAATPIQPICQSDAAANAWLSGNFSSPSAVAGVCGGACVTALVNSLTNYKDCLRVLGYGELVGLMHVCQTKSHCLSESYLTNQLTLMATCGGQLQAAMDFNSVSTSSINSAKEFCVAGGCQSRYLSFMKANAECGVDYGSTDDESMIAASIKIVEHLCTQQTGESDVCAVQLKNFGRFQCYYGRCSDSNYWCDSSCSADFTDARMNALCGRCLSGLADVIAYAGQRSFKSAVDMMCLRVSNGSFCGVNLDYFDTPSTVYGGSYYSQSTLQSRCGGSGASCLSRLLTMQAADSAESAVRSFGSCMSSYIRSGYTEAYARTWCTSSLQYGLASAEGYKRTARIYCAKNSAGGYCMNLLYDMWWRDSCVRYSSCSTSCTNSFGAAADAAGCCTGYFDDYNAGSSTSYLPRRTVYADVKEFNYTTERVQVKEYSATVGSYNPADRSHRYSDDFVGCYENGTAFWAEFEASCPVGNLSSPPRRELAVGLSWAAVSANPAQKANLEAALQADIAATLNVSVGQINGTLQAATVTQRQTTTTQSKYVFTVNAETQAEADAAVADLDAKIAANALRLPSTIQAVDQTDFGQGSSNAAVVQGAAPPPTEPSLGSSGSASSASAVQVAVAVLAALAALLL